VPYRQYGHESRTSISRILRGARRERVGVAPSRAGELSRERGRSGRRQLLREELDDLLQLQSTCSLCSLGRAAHHERDLASREICVICCALRQLPERPPINGLVHLGHLARDHGFAFGSENGREIRERLADAMRCFEEDHRAWLVRQRCKALTALTRAGGQKSLEAETICR